VNIYATNNQALVVIFKHYDALPSKYIQHSDIFNANFVYYDINCKKIVFTFVSNIILRYVIRTVFP